MVTLRFDLDYTPWNESVVERFGHGEPAMVQRLADLARAEGLKFHFFASEASILALPSITELVLNEGHHVDGLVARASAAATAEALLRLGSAVQGMAASQGVYLDPKQLPSTTRFTSSDVEVAGYEWFQPSMPSLGKHISGGNPPASWFDVGKRQLSLPEPVLLVIEPAVLAKVDPTLTLLSELVSTADRLNRKLMTLRDRLSAH